MINYLARALTTLYSNPIGYLHVFLNLLTVTALALVLAYVLYRILGGQWDGIAWLVSRFGAPLPVSGMSARVWRRVVVAGLVVLFIVMEIV